MVNGQGRLDARRFRQKPAPVGLGQYTIRFTLSDGSTIDQGLALWFAAPASYTGEEVLELQIHGGPPTETSGE